MIKEFDSKLIVWMQISEISLLTLNLHQIMYTF